MKQNSPAMKIDCLLWKGNKWKPYSIGLLKNGQVFRPLDGTNRTCLATSNPYICADGTGWSINAQYREDKSDCDTNE